MWPTIRWKNIPRLLFRHRLTLLDMILKVRVADDYHDHYHGGDNELVQKVQVAIIRRRRMAQSK